MSRILKEQIDQEYTWVNSILENSDISFMNHGYYSENGFAAASSGNASRVPDYEDLFNIETYDITNEVMESCRQDAANLSKLDYPEAISQFIIDIPQKFYEWYASGSASYIVHVCKKKG